MAKRPRGRPKNPPKFREMLEGLIPASDMFEPEELEMYQGLVNIYLQDFDESQLTANDFDDVMSIATNRVLEIRLLKTSKKEPSMQIDASLAVERIRKQTEKLKENLATRRKDRIDPKKFSGISIADLALAFDEDKKEQMFKQAEKMKKEEDEVSKSELLTGNRNDEDADTIEEE